MHPPNSYEGRQLLGPFHLRVVDRHCFEIRAELDLEIEIESSYLQLVHEHVGVPAREALGAR